MESYTSLEIGEIFRLNAAENLGETFENHTEPILPRLAVCEKAAVAECLNRYGDLIWSLAKKQICAGEEVEKAVCEIFQDIWKSAKFFDAEKHDEQRFVALVALRRLLKINEQGKIL